jgi:bifunctional non-homologous end joining protein LigD
VPAPGSDAVEPRRFVVQRHRARRLHYDLRFEIDGVLVSWAVPKGPTLDANVRRAAFHVEDHPLEYFDFEGVIPAGKYGGGDVIVWDAGTWVPYKSDDPRGEVAAGELHADIHGTKLRGRFVLVRTSPADSDKDEWLLLHKHDEFASDGWDAEDHPKSVLSGRTNDEVQADPDRMWRSDVPAARASVLLKPSTVAGPTEDELAEFDSFTTSGTWTIFGRDLRVTNLDKVMFPARRADKAVTKRELLRYAAQIAPTVLPYLTRRALTMHRALPARAPEWLPRSDSQLVVDEPAALVWAANRGALEWHAGISRVDHPQQPTYALIDLEPGEATSWDDLLVLARLHRTALEHVGVLGRPKITGGGGIEIWIPIARGPSFDETRAWVEQLARTVGAVVPDLVGWTWQAGTTLAAPYSPRPAAGAPVSTPIEWDELDDPELAPDRITIRTVLDRIRDKGDPFRDVLDVNQRLPVLS